MFNFSIIGGTKVQGKFKLEQKNIYTTLIGDHKIDLREADLSVGTPIKITMCKLIGNAKAVFSGPHRGVSRKHLQRYLSEVCYRFNRRFWNRETFDRLLTACVSTDTVTRDELMAARS